MKRTPLRRVSKKRAPEYRKYLKLRAEALKDAVCEWPLATCTSPAEDVHHMKRRGKLLNDKRFWLLVCRRHHRLIEDNKREARDWGLILYP